MKPLKQQKVALIGGAGFIGHNLALELKRLGCGVHVIDGLEVNNLMSFSSTVDEIPNRDLYLQLIYQRLNLLRDARVPLYVQDARDYHALSKLLDKIQPTAIVLLAAVAHADRANKDPYSTFDHSLRTLENALDYSKKSSVEHFVYFSSSMVYGHFPSGFVTEETPCNPLGIYGALKFAGEKIVIAHQQVFNLPYTIIRPSALYGERCVSRRVGQIFIESAMQGLDISLKGDGSDKLDFTYIGDLVNGIVRVLESPDSRNQIFNLTYGQSRSIAEMVEILRREFPGIKVTFLPKDNLTPSRGTLSVEKARKLIGYEPKYPLDVGYISYLRWYQSIWQSLETHGERKAA